MDQDIRFRPEVESGGDTNDVYRDAGARRATGDSEYAEP